MKILPERLLSWLPQLNPQVWILIAGRLLSGIGSGFTLFYAPIFFANEVGLTKTAVGFALGSASISGVLGRLVSGSLVDSPQWGRKKTLLIATFISAVASFVLGSANNFETLIVGNLLMGLGIGFYWPATESVVADLTTGEQRHEAYAITRLADNLGLQLGVVCGGVLIALTSAYRLLFIIDGSTFLIFTAIVWIAIAEPARHVVHSGRALDGWAAALRDRALIVYVVVNIMFTTYISQIHTIMPLYFTNFVSVGETGEGFAPETISALFTWHLALSILIQLPVSRFLMRFRHAKALTFSALLWALGFIFIGLTGAIATAQLIMAIVGLGILAIATVAYTPSASSLVVEIAPPSLRGVYLSINSQCWAIGYFIGPPLGGWALDMPRPLADGLWPGLVLSVGVTIAILQYLDRILAHRKQTQSEV